MSTSSNRPWSEFDDQEYRHAYADDFLNAFIAAQIRALRDQRGWTQAQLAERARMRQSRISAMEDVNYSSWSVRTLARLAEAFDVSLAVCFKSFRERIVDIDSFSPSALRVASYVDDLLISFGATAPPVIGETSSLIPLRDRVIQAFVEIMSSPMTPERITATTEMQQHIGALLVEVARMYGNTSKEYRSFTEWLLGLTAALTATAQKGVQEAAAKIQEIDEIRRLTQENSALREEIRTLRIAAVEAQKQQHIAEILAEKSRGLAEIHEAAQRDIEQITALRDAVLGVIAGERERIRQLAEATAKSDVSVEQFLREIEESWNRVGEVVHA